MVDVVLPGHTSDASVRGTGLCGESECFFYGECGEMDIIFRNELWIEDIRRGEMESESRNGPAGHHESVPSSRLG